VRTSHPDLLAAAYTLKPFLGWKRALELAGLNYDTIRAHYIDEIPCLICGDTFVLLNAHLEKAHQVTAEEYREEFPDADLMSEVMRFRKGGILDRHPDRLPDWEPALSIEYALDKTSEYYQRGFDVHYTNLNAIDSAITIKLLRELKEGWDLVMEKIGVDPTAHRRTIREDDFTIEEFAEWLLERQEAGLKNTMEAVMDLHQTELEGPVDLRNRIVAWALAFHHRSWTEALEASGLDLSHPAYNERHFPDAQSLLEAIREIAAAGRPTAFLDAVRNRNDATIVFSAPRYFKTWTKALKAAGVPATTEHRELDQKAKVILHLKKHLKNGYRVDEASMWIGTRRDPILFKATFNFFPNWRAAVKAAGGNKVRFTDEAGRDNPFLTKEKVIREFQKLHRAKRFASERRLPRDPRNTALVAMAHGFFGGWRDAAVAAGIDPKSYNDKNLNPTGRYPTKEDVIEGILLRHKKGAPMNARSLTVGENADYALITTARKFFKNWGDAMTVAGLDYSAVVRKKQDYSVARASNQYRTKKEVVAGIRKRFKAGQHLNSRSLSHDPKQRDYPLIRVARELFGSWDKALAAAGFDPALIRRNRASEN
jgi:hypothetical protein